MQMQVWQMAELLLLYGFATAHGHGQRQQEAIGTMDCVHHERGVLRVLAYSRTGAETRLTGTCWATQQSFAFAAVRRRRDLSFLRLWDCS